jgi:hypothetical protein
MGPINRKKPIGILTGDDDPCTVSYCPECWKGSWVSVLGPRVYMPDEPIPRDHDLWKQCWTCGTIFPTYQVENESELKDFVEPTDDLF